MGTKLVFYGVESKLLYSIHNFYANSAIIFTQFVR